MGGSVRVKKEAVGAKGNGLTKKSKNMMEVGAVTVMFGGS